MKPLLVYEPVHRNKRQDRNHLDPANITDVFTALADTTNYVNQSSYHEALEQLRLAVGALRIRIVINDYSARIGRNAFACANSTKLQNDTTPLIRLEALTQGNAVCLCDVKSVPTGHPLLKLISSSDTFKLIVMPLMEKGTLSGLLVLEASESYELSDEMHGVLETFAKIFVSIGLSQTFNDPYKKSIQNTYTTVREDFIIEASNIGTWELDVKANTVSINANLSQLIGFEDAGPMVFKRDLWERLVPEEDLPTVNDELERALNGSKDTVEFEHRLKHAKGHYIWVSVRGKVLAWDEDGLPTRMYGVHVNITERKLALEKLKENNVHLEEKVADKVREIQDSNRALSFALARLTESRDYATGQHVDRVQRMCEALAIQLSKTSKYSTVIDSAFVQNIFYASSMHDIGKIGIPDRILLKPSALDEKERTIMQTHVSIGAEMLDDIISHQPDNQIMRMGFEIIKFHHERVDGAGYPEGLKGNAIPLSARIMALVDAYDALRSKRPYKKALSHNVAIKKIKKDANKHFDGDIVEAFLDIHEQFDAIFNEYSTKEG